MNLDNFLPLFIIGTVSLCGYLYKDEKIYNSKESTIGGLITIGIATIVALLCLIISKTKIDPLSIIIGDIATFFIAKALLSKKIQPVLYLKTIGTLAIFFLGGIFQYIPILLFNLTGDKITPEISTYLSCFSDFMIALTLISLYYDDLKEGIQKAKKNFNQFFDANLKIWMLGFIGMVVSNFLIRLLAPSAVAGNENAVQEMIDISPLLMLLTAGIIAPIVEELTFRKAFQNIIKNKYAFVLISGIIFGLLHVVFAYESMWDFLYVIPYASLGISFAVMVEKSDNICSSIFMHCLHNSSIIIFSILTGMIIL